MIKKCNSCNLEKPFNSFGTNNGGKFGLRSKCFICEKERKLNYYNSNKKFIIASKKEYTKAKINTDPLFKAQLNIRCLVRNSLKGKGFSKKTKTYTYLGCSMKEFICYIESQFNNEISWKNYGTIWTYDHICPLSQAVNLEELIKLQHFSNWQPCKDNFSKSDKKTLEGIKKCQNLLNREWID